MCNMIKNTDLFSTTLSSISNILLYKYYKLDLSTLISKFKQNKNRIFYEYEISSIK